MFEIGRRLFGVVVIRYLRKSAHCYADFLFFLVECPSEIACYLYVLAKASLHAAALSDLQLPHDTLLIL